jgi:hypothetical protein|tara:strand:+ start:3077 stop:3925 length:849 start_codon:yes stop_codon:yes gene_type:complete
MSPKERVTTMLRMIDMILKDERYSGLSHGSRLLYIRLVREADDCGDLEGPLTPALATMAGWLGVARGTAHRYVVELRDAGLLESIPGKAKGIGYSGQAATYNLQTECIGDPSYQRDGYRADPSHQRDGNGEYPSHQRDHIEPSRTSEPEEDARARDSHIQFMDRLHQHLASPDCGGPSWGFKIDADLMAEVKRCIEAGMSEDDILTVCEDATKTATRAVRAWSFYVRVLDTERRERARPAPPARSKPHNDRGMLTWDSDIEAEVALADAQRARARGETGASA